MLNISLYDEDRIYKFSHGGVITNVFKTAFCLLIILKCFNSARGLVLQFSAVKIISSVVLNF